MKKIIIVKLVLILGKVQVMHLNKEYSNELSGNDKDK